MPSKPVPDGTSVVIPRLVCRDPAAAIDFYVKTFGAIERGSRPGPDGTIAHAMLTIGPAMLMIEAERPTLTSRVPKPDGSSPVVIYVYVADVDETVDRAIANGAQVLVPLQDQFWGDRIAWIMDPSGHVWTVASRIEETTADERTGRWANISAEKEAPRQADVASAGPGTRPRGIRRHAHGILAAPAAFAGTPRNIFRTRRFISDARR